MQISVNHLSKKFSDGYAALENVSFSVNQGEHVTILGANGAGKSTLIKTIVGLEKPTTGSIKIGTTELNNITPKKLQQVRQRIGFVFQNLNLVQNLSVFQNVLFGTMGRTRNFLNWWPSTASRYDRELTMSYLEDVGMEHTAKKRVDRLSGGQQQRVAIAKMMMQQPDIVIADEPIASLDPQAGEEIMHLLTSIIKEKQVTMVSVLHQLEISKKYADRLIGLKNGKMVMNTSSYNTNTKHLNELYNKSAVLV
ncbi:phosphonate ABC transporter ATP-binding protein [Salibacterium sp. K-3]